MTTATLKSRQSFSVGTRPLFLTHPDSSIQLPSNCIWMYAASESAEVQYAWYACVAPWIKMNISYLACFVRIGRWYLFCLSPAHLDPAQVLASNSVSHSLLSLSSAFTVVFTHFAGNNRLVVLAYMRSAARLLPDFHLICYCQTQMGSMKIWNSCSSLLFLCLLLSLV